MPSNQQHNFPRLGLIGCGYVSKHHVAASRTVGLPITAVCDRKAAAAEAVVAQTGARAFPTPEALVRSRLVDAVIIATPHFSHVDLATQTFAAGLHVLSEKPLAVSSAEAARAIAVHRGHPDRVFAVNFNQRAWPLWREVKRLIDDGTLGEVTRFHWTIADWYRTQHYYRESSWRGTWAGEGGGLLVNQCPHQLDLLTWFFGLPTRVLASVRFGKNHDIDVEDEVHAIFEYDGPLTGSFMASTGEPLGPNRLEIIGERGQLRVLSESSYELTTFETTVRDHTASSVERSAPPAHTTTVVHTGGHENEYAEMLHNFAAACRGEAVPIASAVDATMSVELANAILLSADAGRAIELPTDQNAFSTLLARLQQRPTPTTAGGMH